MTIQTIASHPTLKRRRPALLHAWRTWWLRAAHRKQMRRLNDVLLDPHMARDLGLPPREKSKLNFGLW